MSLYFAALEPKITKEYLFSKGINQESIMQYYTGLDVSSKKLALSPFRVDHHFTVSFYKSKSGILYLHDFATNEHINCFEAVMKLYNCNYYKALDIIAKDFGLIEGDNLQKVKPCLLKPIEQNKECIIQCQIKDFTKEELEWWNSFGITLKLLKKYNVYSIQHVFLNGNLSFSSTANLPIYGYYFGKDKNKNEKWKIYFPTKTDFRFLNNLSSKILQGYQQLSDKGDLLVITKSMKDCISLRKFGIEAIAPSSESTFISDKQLDNFKKRFNRILVVYDQDRPGKYNLWKIRKKHPELNYFVIPKEFNSKDFSDLVSNYGVEKVKEFINEFLAKYKFV